MQILFLNFSRFVIVFLLFYLNADLANSTNNLIANRYQPNAAGDEITDTKTGLIWKRCSEGQSWNGKTCTGTAKKYYFNQAINLQANGWKLPNIRQLASLIECSSGKFKNKDDVGDFAGPILNKCSGEYKIPTLNQEAFPNVSIFYWNWSISQYKNDLNKSWLVSFVNGNIEEVDHKYTWHVRLVRSFLPIR